MAAGDVLVIEANGNSADIDTALTGKGIVVADNITMCARGNKVLIVVIKAA